MPTARFEADFSGFISAIDQSKIALVNFNTGAQDVEKTLNAMTDQFSGRQLIQEASLMVVAIEKMGGASQLTADELAQVSAKASEAAEKLQAMGSDVPAGIQKYADMAKEASGATSEWSQQVSFLETTLGALGVSFTLAGILNFVKGLSDSAAHIENLAARLQTTTDAVQNFQAVAAATGVPLDRLTSSMQTLQDKIGKGDTGLATLFDQLGLSMDAMKTQDLFTTFQQIATALDGVTDSTQKAEDARVIFGNGWKQILPALSTDIQTTTAQFTKMTPEAVKFWDAMGKGAESAWTRITNVLGNMGSGLLGLEDKLILVSTSMDDAAKAAAKLGPALPTFKDLAPTTLGMQALIDTGNAMTATLEEHLTPAYQQWEKAVAAVDDQTADWHKTLDGLDGVVVESAESLLKLGVNAKDVQTYFQLSDAAMVALQKDMKDWEPVAAAFQAAADATQNWHDTLTSLSGDVVAGAQSYIQLGLSVQQVAKIMGDSVTNMQAVKNGMAEQAAATNSLQKAQAAYNDWLAKTTQDSTTYQINKIWEIVDEEEKSFKGSEDQRAEYNKVVEALADAKTNAIVAAATKETATVTTAATQQTQVVSASLQKQIDAVNAKAAADIKYFDDQRKGWTDDTVALQAHADMTTNMAKQTTDYLISEAERYQHSWSDVMDSTVADSQAAGAKIRSAMSITPGTLDEQQAMKDAVAEVNASSIGQMMQMGTTSVATMNAYQAAIEQAMANRGYSIGGTLTPAAQSAGYGGSAVNTTVNVNGSVLGSSAQLAQAVSAAVADALRRQGATIPTS